MFDAIRDIFEKKRHRKNLAKLFRLTESFASRLGDYFRDNNIAQLSFDPEKKELRDAMPDPLFLAMEDTAENSVVDMTELYVLATFVVGEFYYNLSRNQAKASELLNEYVHKVAEGMFNNNSKDWEHCSIETANQLYDKSIAGFQEKCRCRYLEYKNILYPDGSLADDLMSPCLELVKYVFKTPANLDNVKLRNVKRFTSLQLALFLKECAESLKN